MILKEFIGGVKVMFFGCLMLFGCLMWCEQKKQLKRQQISFQDSFFLSSYDIFHYPFKSSLTRLSVQIKNRPKIQSLFERTKPKTSVVLVWVVSGVRSRKENIKVRWMSQFSCFGSSDTFSSMLIDRFWKRFAPTLIFLSTRIYHPLFYHTITRLFSQI